MAILSRISATLLVSLSIGASMSLSTFAAANPKKMSPKKGSDMPNICDKLDFPKIPTPYPVRHSYSSGQAL